VLVSAAPCGTYAGYQRHLTEDGPIDRACLDARNRYHHEYRQRPQVRDRDSRKAKARQRARSRLVAENPQRYDQLLAEELAALTLAEETP
jgi:hypothetical protein